MEAQDNRSEDSLVRKMTTPPFDPMAEPEVKPSSYEKLNEIADDLREDGKAFKDAWSQRSSALWASVGKKK